MSEPDDGGQAFPIPLAPGLDGSLNAGEPGMTLRDYFAAQALAGLNVGNTKDDTCSPDDVIADIAYRIADAMITRRRQS